jgi:hypothetical protein
MRINFKSWNDQHKSLRKMMADPQTRPGFLPVFQALHQQVHPGLEGDDNLPTYADSLWESVPAEALRVVPAGMEHSAVWCIWHTARIEDVVMNILIAETPQLLYEFDWFDRMGTRFFAIGNEMNPAEIVELSRMIDLSNLRDYWKAVTRRTREVVAALDPLELPQATSPARLQKLWDQGILSEASRPVNDYWQSLTIAGLLLMPPTRHQLFHLNEVKKILQKIRAK